MDQEPEEQLSTVLPRGDVVCRPARELKNIETLGAGVTIPSLLPHALSHVSPISKGTNAFRRLSYTFVPYPATSSWPMTGQTSCKSFQRPRRLSVFVFGRLLTKAPAAPSNSNVRECPLRSILNGDATARQPRASSLLSPILARVSSSFIVADGTA